MMKAWQVILLVALLCLTQFSRAAETPTIRIAGTSVGGWTLEYVHQPISFSTTLVDGVPHIVFTGISTEQLAEGEPYLPVETISFGIPNGATLIAELIDPVFEVTEGQLIAPVPFAQLSDENEALDIYTKSALAYAQDRFFPAIQIDTPSPSTMRQQRVATIRLWPYQYNPATRTLKRLVSAKINVRVSGGSNSEFSSVPSDPQFEQVYKSLLANYDQAKQWRTAPVPVRRDGPDPTRDWFETGRTYYRIPIVQDGWYRVTKANLAAAGAITASIDVSTLQVFGNGVELPIMVGPDTSIEFFARKNYGDSTFTDFYTDTSAYWLTWGGATGLRFVPVAQTGDAPGSNVNSSIVSRHFELNTGYFTGTTTTDIIQNGEVPGEGWYWERMFPNTSTTKTFALDNIDSISSPTSTLRVRLHSMTLDQAATDHHARFWMNDSLVGDILFEGRTGVTFTASFPSTWLKNDTNRIRLMSINTPSVPNLFYLDWFEIEHHRNLKAQSNQLEFLSPVSSGGSPALFTVSGFSTPQIDVFDLVGQRMITGGIISGDSLAGFNIAFKDTFSSQRRYLATTSSGPKPVLSLRQKVFNDIRVNATGADYIIITHQHFTTSAQQLAAHRQTTNNVRAKVIDVQEIYDEFNYGVFDATVIRTFLQHAYQNWQAPAPSNLLMFGDASWDYRGYLPTTIKKNFIPAYGIPASDNWYAAFDSTPIPSMFVGRIPIEDSVQAQRAVSKLIGYDNYDLGEWNKNFLMITGGSTLSEQVTFNNRSETTINTYILPPPIGGTPFRVYKSTLSVIDGENKQIMQDLVRDGLVFMNFLGHSGGRIWGVDIGNPNDLQNTNGKLPFISSVSCNVGAFAEPSNNVLAEDFLMADNRGAVAVWASSSLGYPTPGSLLVNHFLSGVKTDSMRAFGALTTVARMKLYQNSPNDPVTRAMVNLNPLIGDPLTRLAIPLKPDLVVSSSDISLSSSLPTPNDSSLSVRVKIHNYGLVPADSVGVSLSDLYNGQNTSVVSDMKIRPTLHHDSLEIPWDALGKIGRHVLTASLDPANALSEVNELNNVASVDKYIYANLLSVVKPLNYQVVTPGVQTFVVTSPVGRDSTGFQYFFELDTVDTFDSPFNISSGPIAPGVVSGEWTTSVVLNNQLYFWRSRTQEDTLFGNWIVSSFSTSSTAPALPKVRLKESAPKSFSRDELQQAMPTDSGVTIAPRQPINLYSRSLGYRANLNIDYYSIVKLNELTITGHWWTLGNSFMVLRVNDFTGAYEFRAFNVAVQAAQRDSMKAFISSTPAGNYLAMSVIFDGKTNVNESLYVAIESLGATLIRSVVPGNSWAFIGRKGYPATAVESRTNDSAIVSLQVPNYYSFGQGSVTSSPISIPLGWDSLAWAYDIDPGITDAKLALLGLRQEGGQETLRVFSSDSVHIDLDFLNAFTSGPRYSSVRVAGLLTSSDALKTPAFKEWMIDLAPSADLAISSRTLGLFSSVERGTIFNLPVEVYNIGFQGADSARITVSMYDKFNKARPIAAAMMDSIPVGGSNMVEVPIETSDFPRRVTLQVSVAPSKKGKDLVPDNNTAYFELDVTGVVLSGIQAYANGVQLMDGDYVSTRPEIVVRVARESGQQNTLKKVELYINGVLFVPSELRTRSERILDNDMSFDPTLHEGRNDLRFLLLQSDTYGVMDSLEYSVSVNVQNQTRILQVFNYPNPFTNETYFTFTLTGATAPDELTIGIFTVSGRKIREIAVPRSDLQVGFNRVLWDGRDNEGDEIANGYYFYQIVVKGAEGQTETAIEKLVKVR
ncbi:MAG: C25 family cysteine peptidase [Bacteroidota bacterium]